MTPPKLTPMNRFPIPDLILSKDYSTSTQPDVVLRVHIDIPIGEKDDWPKLEQALGASGTRNLGAAYDVIKDYLAHDQTNDDQVRGFNMVRAAFGK